MGQAIKHFGLPSTTEILSSQRLLFLFVNLNKLQIIIYLGYWKSITYWHLLLFQLDLGSPVLVSNQPVGVVTGISNDGENQYLIVLKLWDYENVPFFQV